MSQQDDFEVGPDGKNDDVKHDLQSFLDQDMARIASEYERIQQRVLEDPGTAGDEGEGNWAELLRNWLPSTYTVVNKGRIIGPDGQASPQIDVLVLSPSYPTRLLTKKVYLASGVLAAFECKLTLKADHLVGAGKMAAAVRRLYPNRSGSPYRELVGTPVVGVLAHSHSWKSENSTPTKNIDAALSLAQHTHAAHPRELIDLVCVADLDCWTLTRMAYLGQIYFGEEWSTTRVSHGLPEEGGAMTGYSRRDPGSADEYKNAVAILIVSLLNHLGREDIGVRPLADYYRLAGLTGASQASLFGWPLPDVYTPQIAARVKAGELVNGDVWNEWAMVFY